MLIGISSIKPQVGKTEAALFLKKNMGFIHVEMSDSISIIAEKFFGYNGNKSDNKQRKILQDIGYLGKQIDPTIWIYHSLNIALRKKRGLPENMIVPSFLFYYNMNYTKKEICKNGFDNFFGTPCNVVLGGVRSEAEANEIVKLGGRVLLINRDGNDNTSSNHIVESELMHYEFNDIIYNNGSLDDFYEKIKIFYKK